MAQIVTLKTLKATWCLTAAFCLSSMAQAQVELGPLDYGLAGPAQIETQTLGEAQDFDAGVLKSGALDTSLWQGTSAQRAAELLSSAPFKTTDPIIRNIVRTVILSGGVPPKATDDLSAQAYEAARLQAVLAIESGQQGDSTTVDGFLARNPELARSPLAQVDLAFSKGEWRRACEISDTIKSDRSKTEWARLRATCHGLRGEMSAADVTRDLLRSSGYDDKDYHRQMDALLSGKGPASYHFQGDPLVSFLATRGQEQAHDDEIAGGPVPTRAGDLADMFKRFETVDLATLQSTLGNISFDVEQADLDLETAMADPTARATGRLFVLGQSGDAAALDAFISRAIKAGVSEAVVLNKLAPVIQALPATGRVNTNVARYTQAAISASDIGSLQQMYGALPQGLPQARVALIADAMGGGFTGQDLGRDIESRLSTPEQRAQAVKDAQMALALGAKLSDVAATELASANVPRLTLPQNQLLMLDAAVRNYSRAEVSLRAATLLARPNLNVTDKARITAALTQAGLQPFAGQVAADVFFEGFQTPS